MLVTPAAGWSTVSKLEIHQEATQFCSDAQTNYVSRFKVYIVSVLWGMTMRQCNTTAAVGNRHCLRRLAKGNISIIMMSASRFLNFCQKTAPNVGSIRARCLSLWYNGLFFVLLTIRRQKMLWAADNWLTFRSSCCLECIEFFFSFKRKLLGNLLNKFSNTVIHVIVNHML